MADEAAVVGEDISAAQSPLVTLSFQRDANRKQKYLEAEPKALGITQIALCLFNTCGSVFTDEGFHQVRSEIPFFISSLLVGIAGSVAIAAQNLHLSTLRACLMMQIVACLASIFNTFNALFKMTAIPSLCWHYPYDNYTLQHEETCQRIKGAHVHFYSESAIIQVALFVISVTLAAYCYKVVNCCAPAPRLPVITVQAPPQATMRRTESHADSLNV